MFCYNNKDMNKIKYPKLFLFLSITFICAFIFVPYLIGDKAFILGWDMRTLYSSNFENLRTEVQAFLKDGTLPFWSWVSFLGNDFYSTKLFYFNDFFDIAFAFTNLPYTTVIMCSTYLKFLIAGFSFYAYAKYNKFQSFTCFIGSLLFAFSSYNLQTMMHPFFGSYFVFLPLYFLGVDRYIVEKKKNFFILMVFFLFINNYYLFYSTSLFTILYFIYRWKKEYNSLKDMMKNAIKLIGYYLVGFLFSGAIVLPEVLAILRNSRIGNRSSILLYDSLLPYFNYLFSFIMPTSILANRETILSTLYSYTSKNDSVMAIFLWASSLCALLIPQFFTKERRDKVNGILWIVITCIALIPILSSVMHGFSEPSFRWLANPSFLLIVMLLGLLEDYEHLNQKLLKISFICILICMIGCTPLLAFLQNVPLSSLKEEWYIPLLTLPSFILISIAFIKNKKNILLTGLILELSIVSFFSFFGNPPFSSLTKNELDRLSYLMGEKGQYNRFVLGLDEKNASQFYRNYIDPVNIYWNLSTNYNLDYNIMGLISYDSTYNASANDLKKLDLERVQHYLPWTFNVQNPDIMTLLSTKYAVVMNEEDVPFLHSHYVTNYFEMKIYENEDYYNLGKTYTDIMSYDEYSPSMSNIVTQKVIAHAENRTAIQSLLGKEEVFFDSVRIKGNYVFASITTKEKGFAVLSIPYDLGWKVSVNGKEVSKYEVNGGLIGIPLTTGYNQIDMHFVPHGLKPGIMMSMVGILIWVILLLSPTLFHKKEKE